MSAELKTKKYKKISAFLSSHQKNFYISMDMKLKKVFFRLDSPYEWGKGMSESLSKSFNNEALIILNDLGFDIVADGSKSWSCPEGVQGEQNLYMHPMDFSGILSEDIIQKATDIILAAALKSSIFSVRAIDVFDIENHHLKNIESNLRKQKEFSENKLSSI